MNEIIICLLIALGKSIEILLYTTRTVLSTKNQKKAVTILGFLNNSIGIILLLTVVTGIEDNIWRAISFAIGETLGTYLGMLLEKKLAFGKVVLTIVVNKSISQKVISSLSENGYESTSFQGHGLKNEKVLLKIFTERKRKDDVIKVLNDVNAKAVIFDSNILNYKKINEA